MKVSEAFIEIEQLCDTLQKGSTTIIFNWKKVDPWPGTFKQYFRKEIPGNEASQKSGVYLISDIEENILYIGKATNCNLGAEIYSKFNAATKVDDNDIPAFENSSLARWANNDENRIKLINGEVLIHAAIVEPKEMSSLVEVFLQTYCFMKGDLPPLNKRIG